VVNTANHERQATSGSMAGNLSVECMGGQFEQAMEALMPGASEETRRVKILNANWVPDGAGGDGLFEVMIMTEDDQRYVVPASPGSMTALVALAKADTVMAWDPLNKSLIVANIVGTMPWTVVEGS
jgi:hypothetical protein